MRRALVLVFLVPFGCRPAAPDAAPPDQPPPAAAPAPPGPQTEPEWLPALRSTDELLGQLHSPIPAIRVAAIRELVGRDERAAVPLLLALSPPQSMYAPAVAPAALCELDPSAYETHLRALARVTQSWPERDRYFPPSHDPVEQTARGMARRAALAGLSADRSREAINNASNVLMKDTPPAHPREVAAFRAPLLDPTHPAHRAVKLLVGRQRDQGLLVEVLVKTADPGERRWAVGLLGMAIDPDHHAAVLPLLDDPDPTIRGVIAAGLFVAGDRGRSLAVVLDVAAVAAAAPPGPPLPPGFEAGTSAYLPGATGPYLRTLPWAERRELAARAAGMVRDGPTPRRRVGLSVLREVGWTNPEAYRAGLLDPDPETRNIAFRFTIELCHDPVMAAGLLRLAAAEPAPAPPTWDRDSNRSLLLRMIGARKLAVEDETAFAALHTFCTSGDEKTRELALKALPAAGPRAADGVPLLVAAAREKWADTVRVVNTRHPAADLIAKIGEIGPAAAAAVPYLIEKLTTDGTPDEVAAAVNALRRIGPAAAAAAPALHAEYRRQAAVFHYALRPGQGNYPGRNWEPGQRVILALAAVAPGWKDADPEIATYRAAYPYDPAVRTARWRINPTSDPTFLEDLAAALAVKPDGITRPGENFHHAALRTGQHSIFPLLGPACVPVLEAQIAREADPLRKQTYLAAAAEADPGRLRDWLTAARGVVGPRRGRAELNRAYATSSPTGGTVLPSDGLLALGLRGLAHPDAGTRAAGCRLLGDLRFVATRVLPQLDVIRTTDPDPAVREAAEAAFQAIDDPPPTGP